MSLTKCDPPSWKSKLDMSLFSIAMPIIDHEKILALSESAIPLEFASACVNTSAPKLPPSTLTLLSYDFAIPSISAASLAASDASNDAALLS